MFVREYSQPVRFVKGIGPRYSELLENLNIKTVSDLVHHFPRAYVDRTTVDRISDGLKKESLNIIVKVIGHDYIGWGRNRVLKVIIGDDSGQAALVCFGRNYLESVLLTGREFFVTGTFRKRYNELQSSGFQVEPFDTEGEFDRIVPVYPLTTGLSQGVLRKMVRAAFDVMREGIDDEVPRALAEKYGHIPKRDAIRVLHFPGSMEDLQRARESLAYEELFYLELLIARRAQSKKIRRSIRGSAGGRLRASLVSRLPFELTGDQKTALDEIVADLHSECPMSRLLMGDVGCGKTLVGLLAALDVIENGEQVAFMAPTELLARQHAESIARLVEPLGVVVGFLSGSIKTEERSMLLGALASGGLQLLIGTHAVYSDDVTFRRLGLVIVDEQHRFGVMQRMRLVRKGENPDLLLMTATPIPRSLALTAFGDLDVSTIKTMPSGRKNVITHLARQGNERKVYDRVRKELENGRQAYFVYPLIEESEKIDLKNAMKMFDVLSKEVFPDFRIGIIHSRVAEDEKRTAMDRFARCEIDILVATSVVEVGVDVSNATAIVIEHAERFGLSALHQLRGRVGRGEHQSYAFLVYSENLTEDGIARLRIMMTVSDGFIVAEEDLRLRGPGELLGIHQSGFLKLTVADLVRDSRILARAREDAFALVKEDAGLIRPENEVVRRVLAKAPPSSGAFIDAG